MGLPAEPSLFDLSESVPNSRKSADPYPLQMWLTGIPIRRDRRRSAWVSEVKRRLILKRGMGSWGFASCLPGCPNRFEFSGLGTDAKAH
jgi:hypothetical protein